MGLEAAEMAATMEVDTEEEVAATEVVGATAGEAEGSEGVEDGSATEAYAARRWGTLEGRLYSENALHNYGQKSERTVIRSAP